MNLFTVEKPFSDTLVIKLNRSLAESDLEIVVSGSGDPSGMDDDELRFMSKRMQKGFVVNFKPELMDQLEIAGGVVAKRNRLMTFDDVIASVAPSWEKGVRKFSACVERRADTRKKKKDEIIK